MCDLCDFLRSMFGHDSFLPLQEKVIRNVLAGKDSLVLMPTGGGKSLCYQYPALRLDGVTLVISPLIALMKDQVDALKARGIAADCIHSGMSPADQRRVQAAAYRGRLKILYVAPERVVTRQFRDFLHALKLSLIAIDEAHCISVWGHEFRPDYRSLIMLRDNFPHVPVIALTATATEQVRQDIVDQLRMPDAAQFIASFNRPNLTYHVIPKQHDDEDLDLKALIALLRRHRDGSSIIYRNKRSDTESLAADLAKHGFNALPYHAGLNSDVRRETQEHFLQDDVPIIVATIAFGMGVDKPNVRLVVHYDLPKSVEGYYQETGRAGRDGKPSECVLFYSISDTEMHDYFIGFIEDVDQRKLAEARLEKVIDYAELQTCRRAFLLDYFGEELREENCGACDVCLAKKQRNFVNNRHAVNPGTSVSASHRPDAPATDHNAELFEKLRLLREKLDEKLSLFNDETLRHMAVHLPRDRESLMRVPSMSGNNPWQIGDYFTALICQHLEERRDSKDRLAASDSLTCEEPECSLSTRRGSTTCWLHTWKVCKEPQCTRKFRLPDEGTHIYCRPHFEELLALVRRESRARGLCACGAVCAEGYKSCLDCSKTKNEGDLEHRRAKREDVPRLDSVGYFSLTINYRIHKIKESSDVERDTLLQEPRAKRPRTNNRLQFHLKRFFTPYHTHRRPAVEGEIEGWLNEELTSGYVLQDYEALSTAWGECITAVTEDKLTGKRVQIEGHAEVERDRITQ